MLYGLAVYMACEKYTDHAGKPAMAIESTLKENTPAKNTPEAKAGNTENAEAAAVTKSIK